MNSTTISIKGLDAIKQRLQALPDKIQRKHIRRALKDGSEVVRAEAELRVSRIVRKMPKDNFLFFLRRPDMGPRLRNNVTSKVSVNAGGGTATVGLDYKKVHHGHLVEFGTKPHKIIIKLANGKTIIVNHPGSKAQPFMRPAFDGKGNEAVELMVTELANAVEKEAGSGS